MLAFAPAALDLFFVYDSDFRCEVAEILTHGCQNAGFVGCHDAGRSCFDDRVVDLFQLDVL
jgi:hypothetical protein